MREKEAFSSSVLWSYAMHQMSLASKCHSDSSSQLCFSSHPSSAVSLQLENIDAYHSVCISQHPTRPFLTLINIYIFFFLSRFFSSPFFPLPSLMPESSRWRRRRRKQPRRKRRRRREEEKPRRMSGWENERVMFLCTEGRREWVRNRAEDVLAPRSARLMCLCVCTSAETQEPLDTRSGFWNNKPEQLANGSFCFNSLTGTHFPYHITEYWFT